MPTNKKRGRITDKERLDWIEERLARGFVPVYHFHNHRHYVVCCGMEECKREGYKTVREALDSAIRPERKK